MSLRKTIRKTRDVLEEHLYAKVNFLFPTLADKIIHSLCNSKSNEELIELLSYNQWLEKNLDDIILNLDPEDRNAYGDHLFQAVSAIDQELSAQITGMLLELPPSIVSKLSRNPNDLKIAVEKARKEYLLYLESGKDKKSMVNNVHSSPPNSTHLHSNKFLSYGNLIYEKAAKEYPNEAAKLTGMLLQMQSEWIEKMLKDENTFKEKLKLALDTLKTY